MKPNNKYKHNNGMPKWYTLFQKNSGGISSKRVCGIIGWICCLSLLIAGFVCEKEIPQYAEMVAIISASLLGLDSITGIWTKTINQQNI